MTEKRNWMQMDKCFCSASWGKCKNTDCYRYFGEPEKKYCEENQFEYYSVSDFQNTCDQYAKQMVKESIFANNDSKSYLWKTDKDNNFVYMTFMYDASLHYKQPMVGLHKYHKGDLDTVVEKIIVPYTEFCKDYHLVNKERK